MLPQFSTNAFNNTNPVKGGVAEAVRDGALTGLAGEADLQAGQRVKIDTTNTIPGIVKFVAADPDEAAFGVIKFNSKQDVYAEGDTLEVCFNGGLAMYQVGGGTITPGTVVAQDASGNLVPVDGTHLQMGILIDYVTANSMGRVIIGFVAA